MGIPTVPIFSPARHLDVMDGTDGLTSVRRLFYLYSSIRFWFLRLPVPVVISGMKREAFQFGQMGYRTFCFLDDLNACFSLKGQNALEPGWVQVTRRSGCQCLRISNLTFNQTY